MQLHNGLRIALVGSIVCFLASATVEAQRQLSWDTLDVRRGWTRAACSM